MTARQKIELRLSEVRQRLGQLAGEDPTDETRSEIEGLRTEHSDLELRHQAAILAEPEIEPTETPESSEDLELRELIDGANVGEVIHGVIRGIQPDGQTRELQQHYDLDGNMVPLVLLETRAEANATPAPAAGSRGATQAPVIPYVFPRSAAAFLNVAQPTVPVGERVYTVLSTAAAPGTPAKDADHATTAAAFTAKVLSPGRIQASLAYAVEDAAALRGMDAALRENLSDALSDKLDERVIANLIADGQADDRTAKVVDFAGAVAALYAGVDGRYADEESQVRILLGQTTYGLLANAYRGTGTNETALKRLREDTGGVRVNSNMPAVASKKQKAIFRLGSRMDCVSPIWEGIEIVDDRVTQAKAGQRILTAYMLYAVDTLRSAPIRVVEFKTAA